MRCQGVTRSGRPCSRPGPWCAQHALSDVGPNRQAFEALVARLTAADALLAPGPLVELARTLADDMDAGETHTCSKCHHPVVFGHSAPLVKQYRDLVEVIAGDVGRESPIDKVLERIRNAPSA